MCYTDNSLITKIDMKTNAIKIAQHFLHRANFDGDLISPLKMQKLIYYAYVWVLVNSSKQLFEEKFQAWTNGPVLPSLYQNLKRFGYSPINDLLITDMTDQEILDEIKDNFGINTIEIIEMVYEEYIGKSAFELSAMTHNELPWKKARGELNATENSETELSDEDIIIQYGEK